MRERRLHPVGLSSRRTHLPSHLPPSPNRPPDFTRNAPGITRTKAVVPGGPQSQIQRSRAIVLVNVRGEYPRALIGRRWVQIEGWRQAPALVALVQESMIPQMVVGVRDKKR